MTDSLNKLFLVIWSCLCCGRELERVCFVSVWSIDDFSEFFFSLRFFICTCSIFGATGKIQQKYKSRSGQIYFNVPTFLGTHFYLHPRSITPEEGVRNWSASSTEKQLETLLFVLYLERGLVVFHLKVFRLIFFAIKLLRSECCLNIWNKMPLKEKFSYFRRIRSIRPGAFLEKDVLKI